MTRIQHTKHQEQMEEYRKEFALFWRNTKPSRITDRESAVLELRAWNKWVSEKKTSSQHHGVNK